MARKKEISKDKILDTAYKMAIKDGIEGLTARSIAKAGHFSTQPLYLEFNNMDDLRNQVLRRISNDLRTHTLQQKYVGEPLIDLDLSYIDFAQAHVNLFRAMFVDGKFGSKIIADTLMELGTEKFKEQQYPDVDYDDQKIHDIVIANWISTTGMAALIVNEIASFSQTQIVNVLNAQIHDAMLNNRLSETQENPMFAADEEASLKDNLA